MHAMIEDIQIIIRTQLLIFNGLPLIEYMNLGSGWSKSIFRKHRETNTVLELMEWGTDHKQDVS